VSSDPFAITVRSQQAADDGAAPSRRAGSAASRFHDRRWRAGTAHQRKELVLLALPRRDLGDNLLRQHIERLLGDREAIELSAIDAIQQGRTLDELVA
jgi:hypothetical protein